MGRGTQREADCSSAKHWPCHLRFVPFSSSVFSSVGRAGNVHLTGLCWPVPHPARLGGAQAPHRGPPARRPLAGLEARLPRGEPRADPRPGAPAARLARPPGATGEALEPGVPGAPSWAASLPPAQRRARGHSPKAEEAQEARARRDLGKPRPGRRGWSGPAQGCGEVGPAPAGAGASARPEPGKGGRGRRRGGGGAARA